MSNEQTQIKPEAGAVVIANLVNEADGLQGMLVKVTTSCFGGIGESVPAYKVYCYDMDAAQTVSVRSFRADVEGSLQKAYNFAQSFAASEHDRPRRAAEKGHAVPAARDWKIRAAPPVSSRRGLRRDKRFQNNRKEENMTELTSKPTVCNIYLSEEECGAIRARQAQLQTDNEALCGAVAALEVAHNTLVENVTRLAYAAETERYRTNWRVRFWSGPIWQWWLRSSLRMRFPKAGRFFEERR